MLRIARSENIRYFYAMIRLSLVIATYNRSVPLLAALESVVRQDASPSEWECVVVNNNSQDDTEARFAEFAARYPALHLRMVRETRQGLSCLLYTSDAADEL